MRIFLASLVLLVAACSSNASPSSSSIPVQHRPTAIACASNGVTTKACTADPDCNATPGGGTAGDIRCRGGFCAADECLTDDDCGAGHACSCKGATRVYAGATPGNLCVAAQCRTDADCGAGGFCSPSYGDCGAFYGIEGYYCHTAADACRSDADCDGSDGGFGQPWCGFDTTAGKWACKTGGCAG